MTYELKDTTEMSIYNKMKSLLDREVIDLDSWHRHNNFIRSIDSWQKEHDNKRLWAEKEYYNRTLVERPHGYKIHLGKLARIIDSIEDSIEGLFDFELEETERVANIRFESAEETLNNVFYKALEEEFSEQWLDLFFDSFEWKGRLEILKRKAEDFIERRNNDRDDFLERADYEYERHLELQEMN